MRLFKWFRESIKNAFLGGINDALEELNAVPEADMPTRVVLRLAFAPAAPAPSVANGHAPAKARRAKTD